MNIMKNRKLNRLVRRTAAVIGTGIVTGAAVATPIIAPVVNVYAADSYETEQKDYSSALKTAKKTNGLKVKETVETVDVLESQVAAKKNELAEKIDAETQKLTTATNTQKANNNDYNSKVNNPNYLLDTFNEHFEKDDLINLLSDGETFNYSNIIDFKFSFDPNNWRNTSNAPKITEEHKNKLLSIFHGEDAEGLRNYLNACDERGHVYEVKVGDTFVKYANENDEDAEVLKDPETGRPLNIKFTLTGIEDGETPEGEEPLHVMIVEGRTIVQFGTIKKATWYVELLDAETGDPVTSDVLIGLKDIDDLQTFSSNQFKKTMLAKEAKNNTLTTNGKTLTDVSGELREVENPEGFGAGVMRSVDAFDFSWEGGKDKGISYAEIIDITGIDLGLNIPVREKTTVNVKTYNLNIIPDPQKGSVTYIDKTTGKTLESKKLDGVNNEPFNYNPTDTIKKYTDMGYKLVSNDYPEKEADQKFDTDPKVDQDYTIVLEQRIVNIPPDKPGYDVKETDLNKTIKRTIFYKYETKDGKDVYEPITQTVKLTRSATENLVTKEITYTPWTEGKMETVESKPKTNYTYDREKVDGVDPVKSDTKVNDEYVIYTKIPQKGSVNFTDKTTKKPIADTKKLNGHNAEPFGYTPDATIKKLEDKGYDLVSNDFPKDEKDQVYDTDSKVDQDFHVVMTPHIEKIPPTNPKKPGDPARPEVPYPEGLEAKDLNKTLTRTIYYKYNSPEGEDVFEPVKQTVKLTRSATFNYVTGEIVYEPWTTGKIEDVTSPKKTNYTLDRAVVEGVPEVTNKTKLEDQYVIYKKIPQKGSVDFTDRDSKKPIADTKKLNGYNAEPFNYTPDNTIQKLTDGGYDLVSNDFPKDKKDQVYDTDSKVDQDFHVVMTPHIEDITPDKPKDPGSNTDRKDVKYPEGLEAKNLNKTLSRTIYYKYNNKDGEDVFEPVKQSVKLTRTAKFNYVTGEIKYGNWTVATIKDVKSPDKENYSYDRSVVEGVPEVKVDTKLEDQYVIYKKIPQKGSVDFTDRDTKEEVNPTKKLDGFQAEPFNYTPDSTIKKLENRGWDLVSNDFPEDKKDQVYDKDPKADQDFHVVMTPHIEVIPPEDPKAPGTPTDRDEVKYPEGVDVDDLNKTFTRTIFYKYESPEGEDVFEPVEQTVTLTRPATFNYVTGEIKYGDWTTATIEDVESQVKEHYQFDRAVVEGVDLTSESEPLEDQYVIYTRVPEKGKMEFTDEGNNPIADTHELNGFDEDPFDYDPAPVLEDLHNKGWDLLTNNYPEKPEDQVFDSDPNVDQDFKAVHTPHIEVIKPDDPKKPGSDTDRKDVKYPEGVDEADLNKTFTRTIYFKYNDKNGNDVFEPVKQEVHLTREAKFNYVTGEVEYTEWTTDSMAAVDAKTKEGYVFDRSKIDELILTGDSETPVDEYIIYTPESKEETPVSPVTPNVSTGSPVSPSTSLNRTSGTNTGDHSKTGLFVALGTGAAAAIAGIAAFLFKRKKREDEA